MVPDDLPQVGPIADVVHRNLHEAHTVYANRLAIYPAGCLTYRRDGVMLGYLISHPWRADDPPKLGDLIPAIPVDADCYYLHDIALLHPARGSGAGRQAFVSCVAMARAADMETIELVAVNGADGFWSALGFARVASAASEAYGDGSCLMRLSITE